VLVPVFKGQGVPARCRCLLQMVRGRLLGAGAWFKWSGGACSVQVPVSIVKGVLAGAGACLK
jgi:hypothetical protein